MDERTLRDLLQRVRSGETEIDDAMGRLKAAPFEELDGFATCAPNVAVVNVDNGFGAGFLTGLIAQE